MEKAYFSGIRNRIIPCLNKATKKIQVAMAWFTSNELFEALRALRATFFMGELPTPHLDGWVLLLPRGEPRSMIAAHTLANAGFFDLGAHLLTLLNKQTGYPERV